MWRRRLADPNGDEGVNFRGCATLGERAAKRIIIAHPGLSLTVAFPHRRRRRYSVSVPPGRRRWPVHRGAKIESASRTIMNKLDIITM